MPPTRKKADSRTDHSTAANTMDCRAAHAARNDSTQALTTSSHKHRWQVGEATALSPYRAILCPLSLRVFSLCPADIVRIHPRAAHLTCFFLLESQAAFCEFILLGDYDDTISSTNRASEV